MKKPNQPAPGRRLNFAGFVCWIRPAQAEPSTRKFLSIADAVKQALEREYPAIEESAGKWRAVRVTEPGRYFLGFARRPGFSGNSPSQ